MERKDNLLESLIAPAYRRKMPRYRLYRLCAWCGAWLDSTKDTVVLTVHFGALCGGCYS